MDQEIYKKLEQLAFERSVPFCYPCYEIAPEGKCYKCGSDDLMRCLPSVGAEWGINWVIEEILREELEPVDLEEAFEQSIRDCYPEEVKVGWLTLDMVSVMKAMDPVSWRCAQSEWESQEADEGQIITLDNGQTYYWLHDVESLI